MGFSEQYDTHPTLAVSAHPLVGLLPFRRNTAGYVFKCILRLHAEEAIHRHNKGGKVTTFMDSGLQILLLLLLRLKTLLWLHVPVRDGISVHNTHVFNAFSPSLPEVMDEKVFLLILVILG